MSRNLRKSRENSQSLKKENIKKGKINDNHDWRDSTNTTEEKIGYLFNTSLYSDVKLIVNDGKKIKEFKVHEFMLRLSSSVFETALSSGFKESSTKTIKIDDIEIDIFELFLKFLYMQSIKLTSLEQSFELYKVAHRYMNSSLKNFCVTYILQNQNTTTACTGYEFANFYMIEDLRTKYFKLIKESTSTVIATNDFLNASLETVSAILDLDQLNAGREIVLFKAIEKWINNMSEKKGKEIKDELCGKLIPKIRYMSMTAQEFSEGPIESGLLKYEHWPAILANLTTSKCSIPYPTGFNKTTRSTYYYNYNTTSNCSIPYPTSFNQYFNQQYSQ